MAISTKKYENMTARQEAITKIEEALTALKEEVITNQENWRVEVPPLLSQSALEELEKLLAAAKAGKALRPLWKKTENNRHFLAELPFARGSTIINLIFAAYGACKWVREEGTK